MSGYQGKKNIPRITVSIASLLEKILHVPSGSGGFFFTGGEPAGLDQKLANA